jgi:sialate O-acetylesterase
VRAHDTNGEGGFGGKPEDMRLRVADMDGASIGLAGGWKFHRGVDQNDLPARPRAPRPHSHAPSALYNGMIAPLVPFAIRGAIWYQGESNLGRNEQYRALFPAMIANWRESFGRPDFPFYFVQIAPYNYGNVGDAAGRLREAQREALAVPNTGMAVTMDIGNPADIHPKNKLDVGHRLALWARAKTYGDESVRVWSGPLFRSAAREGAALRLSFDSVGEGLRARGGGELTHFTVAGADRVFHPAQASIDGATILVSSPEVPEPLAVRFAFGTADEPNLENSAGLPSPSFRSDNW